VDLFLEILVAPPFAFQPPPTRPIAAQERSALRSDPWVHLPTQSFKRSVPVRDDADKRGIMSVTTSFARLSSTPVKL